MDRVKEIETAITNLPPDEYRRLAEWFHARENAFWDEQIDNDSKNGRLDFLFNEAESEGDQRLLRDWPPAK